MEENSSKSELKSKRVKNFTKEQRDIVQKWIDENWRNSYPNEDQIDELVRKTGATHKQIKKALYNRRPNLRKSLKEKGFNPKDAYFKVNNPLLQKVKEFLIENWENSYPTKDQLIELINKTGATRQQVRLTLKNGRFNFLRNFIINVKCKDPDIYIKKSTHQKVANE